MGQIAYMNVELVIINFLARPHAGRFYFSIFPIYLPKKYASFSICSQHDKSQVSRLGKLTDKYMGGRTATLKMTPFLVPRAMDSIEPRNP